MQQPENISYGSFPHIRPVDITLCHTMFLTNVQVHNYNTHQMDHYHVPGFKSRPGKINLRYNGVIVYILSSGGPVDVSQAAFFPNNWNVL